MFFTPQRELPTPVRSMLVFLTWFCVITSTLLIQNAMQDTLLYTIPDRDLVRVIVQWAIVVLMLCAFFLVSCFLRRNSHIYNQAIVAMGDYNLAAVVFQPDPTKK